jgi:hypothetical protein
MQRESAVVEHEPLLVLELSAGRNSSQSWTTSLITPHDSHTQQQADHSIGMGDHGVVWRSEVDPLAIRPRTDEPS